MPIDLASVVEQVDASGPPNIALIKPRSTSQRLGVFASSFNPLTVAHVELIQRAAEGYTMGTILALAGKTNADKQDYECSLEDRLAMLVLGFQDSPNVSIGLSSHAFYVDMIDALERAYPEQTDLHFIVGFDTFERVLDVKNQYTNRYYRKFRNRLEALEHLFARATFIVAGRSGAGVQNLKILIEHEPTVPPDRVLYLDIPSDLGELSATEVRRRRRSSRPIKGLVPLSVEHYIQEHGLYAS